jgi:hypothetical protein
MSSRSPLLLVCLALAALPALAAPVDADTAAADPYELAMRWTLAGLSPPVVGSAPAVAAPTPTPRLSQLPLGTTDGGVPDPSAYALMGLALLGAGLVARRLGAGQRGFSKKT